MTVEWDYSSIHPMILYAQAGDQMPADAYAIPGWEEEYRSLIKLAFQQLVNCAPATRSRGRWRTLAPDLIPEPEPVEWNKLKKYEKAKLSRIEFTRITGRDYSTLLNDIIEYHEPFRIGSSQEHGHPYSIVMQR